MRCPKCHYISFGSVDRCRNCGYEFSLATEPKPVDLPIQSGDAAVGPLRDLNLSSDRPPPAAKAAAPASGRLDLPLFTDRDPVDDAPLVSAGAAPRQPLSVRRAPPPPPRPRFEASSAAPMLEVDEPGAEPDHAKDARRRHREDEVRRLRESLQVRASRSASVDELRVAPLIARMIAGLVDVAIIVGIDAGVVFATLRVLGLEMNQAIVLPRIPLGLFLLLLNGGYLATFTAAGGQTIGKMLAGIRVIAQRPGDDQGFERYTLRVSLGAAVLRAAAYLVSLLPAGLGFAAILLDKDGRALHDRLAETRVVRA